MVIDMKVAVTLTIDHIVKKKAMNLIQNKLNSSLSKEVENYLRIMVDNHEKS